MVTGVTDATSEILNRLAKPEARLAYGLRNPLNQRRRVRIACTRGTRHPRLRTTNGKRKRPVTNQQPDPGLTSKTQKYVKILQLHNEPPSIAPPRFGWHSGV